MNIVPSSSLELKRAERNDLPQDSVMDTGFLNLQQESPKESWRRGKGEKKRGCRGEEEVKKR